MKQQLSIKTVFLPWLLGTGLALCAFVMYEASPVVSPGAAEILGFSRKDLSCLWAAVAVLLLFAICLKRVALSVALGLTFLFAFASPQWSYLSRGEAHDGLAIASMLLALYLFGMNRAQVPMRALAGVYAAISIGLFPFHIFTAFALLVLCFDDRFKHGLAFLISVSITLLTIWSLEFGGFLSAGIPYLSLHFHRQFFEVFAAYFVSPARGLLIYCPFLLAAFLGFIWTPQRPVFDVVLLAVAFVQCAFAALSVHWWGRGYGPHQLAHVVPLLFIVLAGVIGRLERIGGYKAMVLMVIVGVGGVVGIGLHSYGAMSHEGWRWNSNLVDINKSPNRVWDWRDPPFLRGF